MPPMLQDPRQAALTVLNRLEREQTTLDTLVDDVLNTNRALSKKDRALANALIYGVLRHQRRLDVIISHFSKTPLKKIDPAVRNILRLGIFQLTEMSRIPDSAAVNTSVNMAKSVAPPWVVRYVNGMLRNASRHQDLAAIPSKDLSISQSFPRWMINRWIKRFGPLETGNLCGAFNEIPPLTLRTNTLVTSRDDLMASIRSEEGVPGTSGKAMFRMEASNVSPVAIRLYNVFKPIHTFESFKKGCFQVQDEAAQLSSILLNPEPGDKVLDACAGLGGKSAHLAQLMQNKGTVMAVDINQKKLDRLDDEMKRLGISIVKPSVHDLNRPFLEDHSFDKILLDAPCSGLGVIRRNPDVKWRSSEEHIKRCAERQLAFLSRISEKLKPGGILVYTVCSMEPEENDQVIRAFLSRKKPFAVDRSIGHLTKEAAPLLDGKGYLRTYPHLHKTDGFFSVRIKRES